MSNVNSEKTARVVRKYKLRGGDYETRVDSRDPDYTLLQLASETDFDSEEFDEVSDLDVGQQVKLDNGPIVIRVE